MSNQMIERHAKQLRAIAGECALFLQRNGDFPLVSPCRIALFGSGARHTLKGGTGSGDVEIEDFITIERALEMSGFSVVSKCWLDAYDTEKSSCRRAFLERLRKEAAERKMNLFDIAFGKIEPEHDYNIPIDGEAEVGIYVLSRVSGEGNDRVTEKGDFCLTDTEVRDILTVSRKYKKSMLVLNVGGVVDLTPVLGVSNILYLSQLGTVTGLVFTDILLGKADPAGKLAATWANVHDYADIGTFGQKNDTRYNEGIYVGYRWFDAVRKKPLFSFGYGRSYTDFSIAPLEVLADGGEIGVSVSVKNIGAYGGKETVQVYVAPPKGTIDKPVRSLVAFAKTENLAPDEECAVTLKFSMQSLASYFTEAGQFRLEKGDYIVYVGNSSVDLIPAAILRLNETVVTQQLKNMLGSPDFVDYVPEYEQEMVQGVPIVLISSEKITTYTAGYVADRHIAPQVAAMTDNELIYLCVGAHQVNCTGTVIGTSSQHVAGVSGETTNHLSDKLAGKYLSMADGPAGLRISFEYIEAEGGVRGVYPVIPYGLYELVDEETNERVRKFYDSIPKETIKRQLVTSIPIESALANSWDTKLLEICGDIVGEEMEAYGVQIWLAPAMNIHRSPLCGRNFEYYSEDPYLTGKCAAAVVRGVQRHKNRGATIKHFAANNQETNRYNSNSLVSERALREIYLRGFEICIRESTPRAVMTSYNLLNGEHTSQRADLLDGVLRGEWGYNGMVMTDWITSGQNHDPSSKHPPVFAHKIIGAGNDIVMPGGQPDVDDLKSALSKGELSREQLEICATRIYETIMVLNQ